MDETWRIGGRLDGTRGDAWKLASELAERRGIRLAECVANGTRDGK